MKTDSFTVRISANWRTGEKGFLEGRAVLSTLQYAIRENGTFYGLVGFDDCGIRRFWTREQIEALTFTGKLLSVFLLKYRTQDALSESVLNLHSVLDQQEVWLYVLDPDTTPCVTSTERQRNWCRKQNPAGPAMRCFISGTVPAKTVRLNKPLRPGRVPWSCTTIFWECGF